MYPAFFWYLLHFLYFLAFQRRRRMRMLDSDDLDSLAYTVDDLQPAVAATVKWLDKKTKQANASIQVRPRL